VLENTTTNAVEVQKRPGIIRRRQARFRKLTDMDGRTRSGRRARELARQFEAALGGADALSDGQRLAVARAATLTAISEDKRMRVLAGEHVLLNDLVRVERLAQQAVRNLGLDQRQREPEGLSALLKANPHG
jgi:hypothetical protein